MPAEPEAADLLPVARIVSPWGRRGEVKVEVVSDLPEHFIPGSHLYLKGALVVVESTRRHRQALLLKLEGVDTATAAEGLRGEVLERPRAELPPLPDDAYYHFQLVGMRVRTTEGLLVGEIADILSTGANDVYLVRGEGQEVLLPAVDEVVKSVDLETGEMVVEAIEGLLEDKANP